MQISELGKNRSNIRGIGDAVGKAKQKMQGEAVSRSEREKVPEESFQDSLQKSMNMGLAAERSGAGCRNESEQRGDGAGRTVTGVISCKEPDFGKNIAEGAAARIEQGREAWRAREAEVRRIPYSECDKVEINVLEGYTLKAKLEAGEMKNGIRSCNVYVEMKNEEGEIKAVLFDGSSLCTDSDDAMERIAYAAMEAERSK